MRMKQIIAKDMKEAMTLARETLGDDAVLLSTQKQPGSKGIVVTFAVEEELFEETFQSPFEQTSNDNIAPEPVPAPKAPKAPPTKKETKPTQTHVARSAYPAYDLLLSIMAYHKLPEELFIKLTALLDRIDLPEQLSYESCEQILTQIISPHVGMKPLNLADHVNGKALMFVGPYASGKTSLVAKYATQAHMAGLPVMIFSTDTERMGGLAMLEGLKPLLGCEVMVAETRTQLRNLIKSQTGKHVLLIDSPGVNIYEFQQMKALGEFASLGDVEPILTCPAGIDRDEALELASVFSFLNIQRFALTRADSARHFSSVFALLHEGYGLATVSRSAKLSTAPEEASHSLLAQLICAYIRERMAT